MFLVLLFGFHIPIDGDVGTGSTNSGTAMNSKRRIWIVDTIYFISISHYEWNVIFVVITKTDLE